MRALILAGGSGTRLGLGEKPLVMVNGIPMIELIIRAFEEAGCEVLVVLSPRTPYTHNWCRARNISHYSAVGAGYVEDIVETVQVLEEEGPLFTSVSDIPCIGADIIKIVFDAYQKSGKDACSVWVPRSYTHEYGCRASYVREVDGVAACPSGINILLGSRIVKPQEELSLLINDPRLAFNVNTRED
ncbi:MAG TPA: NTP transferase domain-containing protein, partial [Methanoregulaceae archaeon]|nr:NTP transferase domain-containing protein [Methanoregulaceae archaeon]